MSTSQVWIVRREGGGGGGVVVMVETNLSLCTLCLHLTEEQVVAISVPLQMNQSTESVHGRCVQSWWMQRDVEM